MNTRKTYLKPEIKMVSIELDNSIAAGSGTISVSGPMPPQCTSTGLRVDGPNAKESRTIIVGNDAWK